MNIETKIENQELSEQRPNKAVLIVETKFEAEKTIKEFWGSIPQGEMLNKAKIDDWTDQITMLNRTQARQINDGQNKGKWEILFSGNYDPLTEEAFLWLKSKKIL